MDLKFNEKNETIIPEGYKWCENCEALTPHNKGKTFEGSTRCAVCDNFKTGIVECPRCGCEEAEDQSHSYTATRHHPGCHRNKDRDDGGFQLTYSHADQILRDFKHDFMRPAPDRGSFCLPRDKEWYGKNMRLKKQLAAHDKQFDCGCPRFTLYKIPHQIVLEEHSYPSMDCSTAYRWRYRVRCPICGHVYEDDADSC